VKKIVEDEEKKKGEQVTGEVMGGLIRQPRNTQTDLIESAYRKFSRKKERHQGRRHATGLGSGYSSLQ